jgi:hypothetical protein
MYSTVDAEEQDSQASIAKERMRLKTEAIGDEGKSKSQK